MEMKAILLMKEIQRKKNYTKCLCNLVTNSLTKTQVW